MTRSLLLWRRCIVANVAQKVFTLIKPIVEQTGLVLWDVRFLKEGASHYLRVYIYREEGVSIDDCTAVSHAIDPVIDGADPINVPYYLEVCSTGIETELTKPEHYEILKGKTVTVKLYKEQNGKKEWSGEITGYENGPVIKTAEGETLVFGKDEISKAYLSE